MSSQTITVVSIPLALISYIADYVNEELERGATIDKYTITDAIIAYEGGADDNEN